MADHGIFKSLFTSKHRRPDEPSAKDVAESASLDSPHMQARYEVDKLTRLPDGTTLVKYHFAADDEANALCMKDPYVHKPCVTAGDRVKQADLEAMDAIVRESGAKIKFVEASPAENADITFVEHDGLDLRFSGEAGRANGKSLSVIDVDVDARIYHHYFGNGPVGESALQQHLRSHAAHEIEHILGAKHSYVNEGGNSRAFRKDSKMTKTVMDAGFVVGNGNHVLGPLDIAWYQQHFGKAEPASLEAIEAPTMQVMNARLEKKER
jgi:hypothetical protein